MSSFIFRIPHVFSHLSRTVPRRFISVSGVSVVQRLEFDHLKGELEHLIRVKNIAPLLVSLPWHHSGEFGHRNQTETPTSVAEIMLEPVKRKYRHISYLDFICFASLVAIEVLGGPSIPFVAGRTDAGIFENPSDGDQGADHIRDLFGRYGFSDQEMVVLMGAHGVGRCHSKRSGYDGRWTPEPFAFNNQYFIKLLGEDWLQVESSKGRIQYRDPDGYIMLNSDMALLKDSSFRYWVEIYAQDQQIFFEDFKNAFGKLINNSMILKPVWATEGVRM